jgi:predicted TIM-barrel fold metal-dependent hydrolase
MYIDINTSVGHWPFEKVRYNTCEKLMQRMDEFGVDRSVVSSLHGIFYKNTQIANEELMEEIKTNKKFSSRFIPFAVLNPVYANWQADLKTCVKMGMKGIKLYPQYHDYDITEPPVLDLVKMARDNGLIIALTIKMVDSRQRSWIDIPEEWPLKKFLPLIQAVPDAKYMLLNISTGFLTDQSDINILKQKNILIDTSGRSLVKMKPLIDTYGIDHFAFGTHSPIFDYLTSMLRIETLRDNEVTANEKELLRSGNAKKFLNL